MKIRVALVCFCMGLAGCFFEVRAGGCCCKQAVSDSVRLSSDALALIADDDSLVSRGRRAFDLGPRDSDAPRSRADVFLERELVAGAAASVPVDCFGALRQAPEILLDTPEVLLPLTSSHAVLFDDTSAVYEASYTGNSFESSVSQGEPCSSTEVLEDTRDEMGRVFERRGRQKTPQRAGKSKEADFSGPHLVRIDSKDNLRRVLVQANLVGLWERQGKFFDQKAVYAIFRKNEKVRSLIPDDDFLAPESEQPFEIDTAQEERGVVTASASEKDSLAVITHQESEDSMSGEGAVFIASRIDGAGNECDVGGPS